MDWMTGIQFLAGAVVGTGSSYLGVKWLGCEADHFLPSSAKFKNEWSYISIPLMSLVLMLLCLVGHRDKFTFTF
jgi:hypothetical protein